MDKEFLYNDQEALINPQEISSKQILEIYFPTWSRKMKEVGKENLISEELCIEDWVIINWAWPKP